MPRTACSRKISNERDALLRDGGRRTLYVIERRGRSPESAIERELVEMERGPVGKQHRLVALPFVGLHVAFARLAAIEPQPALAFDNDGRQLLCVGLAEWAHCPSVTPLRGTAAARQ